MNRLSRTARGKHKSLAFIRKISRFAGNADGKKRLRIGYRGLMFVPIAVIGVSAFLIGGDLTDKYAERHQKTENGIIYTADELVTAEEGETDTESDTETEDDGNDKFPQRKDGAKAVDEDGGATETPKIDINTATAERLETLPGIGGETAKRIVKERERMGGFKKIEDLLGVTGIGKAKFARIKEKITVGD